MKLLIVQSSPASRHFLPLRSIYPPQYPVSKTSSIYVLRHLVLLGKCNGHVVPTESQEMHIKFWWGNLMGSGDLEDREGDEGS